MLTLKPDGKTARMNLASPIINILLRRRLLQNYVILNLAMTKSKGFNLQKCITKASQKLY